MRAFRQNAREMYQENLRRPDEATYWRAAHAAIVHRMRRPGELTVYWHCAIYNDWPAGGIKHVKKHQVKSFGDQRVDLRCCHECL